MKWPLLLLTTAVVLSAIDPDGTTPLHWAAHNDDVAGAQRLLKSGADPKAANQFGITPLSLACTNGTVQPLFMYSTSMARPKLSGCAWSTCMKTK